MPALRAHAQIKESHGTLLLGYVHITHFRNHDGNIRSLETYNLSHDFQSCEGFIFVSFTIFEKLLLKSDTLFCLPCMYEHQKPSAYDVAIMALKIVGLYYCGKLIDTG